MQQKSAEDIDQMSSLSKEFRQKLKTDGYFISRLQIIKKLEDPNGTIKYVFKLSDDNKIETVLLDDESRKTLCISSQVGCKLGCEFCATARLGFTRNLTAAEIVDQVMQIERDQKLKISNVVFMGMGEPLDNYDNVLKAVKILNDPSGRTIGARHITISTAGLIPGIKKLAEEKMQIRLAVSVHTNINKLRDRLMPINKRYPVNELIKALEEYQEKTGRRITIEYVMIKGINDDRTDARGLLNLLSGLKVNINIIEYNPHSKAEFEPPSHKTMKDFAWVIADRGIETNIRFRRGRSVKAACGQLGSDN
jgi:23S rRNA (adenine2503-C2)-methyltransferase